MGEGLADPNGSKGVSLERLDERVKAHERELELNRREHQQIFDLLRPLSALPGQLAALSARFDAFINQQHGDEGAEATRNIMLSSLDEMRTQNIRYLVLALTSVFISIFAIAVTVALTR